MRRKRCLFATAAAPPLLHEDAGPSTSGRTHSACDGSGGGGGGGGSGGGRRACSTATGHGAAGDSVASWVWVLQPAPQTSDSQWAAGPGSSGRGWREPRRQSPRGPGGGGYSGCSRGLLLASLSTSAVASGAGGRVAESNDGGGGGRGGGGGVFNLPQLSIMRLPGSAAFAEDQDQAQELLDYHNAKHGGLPRPCPRCQSAEFMVRRPDAARGAPGVVDWPSRPLRCDTCGVWVHLGCEGVQLAEEVPPKPWFHCRACRETFLRMESAAERNPHPSSASPTHNLYLLTPADHASGQAGAGLLARPRGPVRAVLPLLAQGFNQDAIQGFGQPAREYDGGKYSAVLVQRGKPVAVATFNVFGSDAQLCLLATGLQQRLQGNGSALVTDLEAALAALGVSRLLVQARGVALPLWMSRLGYSLVEPGEAGKLHSRLPVAYYDCAILQKALQRPL